MVLHCCVPCNVDCADVLMATVMLHDASPREQRNCERRLMRQLAQSQAKLEKTKAQLNISEKVGH